MADIEIHETQTDEPAVDHGAGATAEPHEGSAAPAPRRSRGTRRGWRVNWPVFFVTLAVVAVVAPAAYFWHALQAQNTTSTLLKRAQSLYKAEDWSAASSAYHRYLQAVPDDAEAIVLRARAFDKTVNDNERDQIARSISLLYPAIEAYPDDLELRQRLCERLMRAERYADAQLQAELMIEQLADDGEADDLEAVRLRVSAVQAQLGPSKKPSLEDVVAVHLEGLDKHPHDLPIASSLAQLYRSHVTEFPLADNVVGKADKLIDDAVAGNPDDPEALLARYQYRRAYGIAGYQDDLARALELAPDSLEVLLAAAIEAMQSADTRDAAIAHLRRAIDIDEEPKDRRPYLILAEAYMTLGDLESAEAALVDGMKVKEIGGSDYGLNRALLSVQIERRAQEAASQTHKLLTTRLRQIGPLLNSVSRRLLQDELDLAQAQIWLIRDVEQDPAQAYSDAAKAAEDLLRLNLTAVEDKDADRNQAQRARRLSLLSQAYTRTGDSAKALAAAEEAARLSADNGPYALALAAMYRDGGNFARAVALCEAIASRGPAPLQVWRLWAESQIALELPKRSATSGQLAGTHAVLERWRQASSAGETPNELSLIEGVVAMAEGRQAEALDLLRPLADAKGMSTADYSRLSLLLESLGEPQLADRALSQISPTERFDLVASAKAALLARRNQFEAAQSVLDEAIVQLRKSTSSSVDDALELQSAMILLQQPGGTPKAVALLAKMRDEGCLSLPALRIGAELAVENAAELSKYEKALERAEGPNGLVWRYYRALRLLKEGDASQLQTARVLVDEIRKLRSDWPELLILEAKVLEATGGDPAKAIALYQQAIQRGAREATAFTSLITGLYRQGRFAEAASYIRAMGSSIGASKELSGTASTELIRQGRVEDAVRIAKTSVDLHPDDAMTKLWYGQALTASGATAEAEQVFRRATQDAPKDERAWGGLIWFYVQTKRLDEARLVLEAMTRNVTATPEERALLMARALTMIGDRAQAEIQYQSVLDSTQDKAKLLEEMGRFYLAYDLDKASATFRRLMEIAPDSAVARRSLALLLGLRGSEAEWNEARELLDSPARETAELAPDRRLEALLLLNRGTEAERAEAVDILAELAAVDQQDPTDKLLLARALELSDKTDEARAQMLAVVEKNPTPAYVGLYAAFLLRHKLFDELPAWLDRLDQTEPNGVRGLVLRSRWLNETGRLAEVEPLLEDRVEKYLATAQSSAQKAQMLGAAGELLLELQLDAPAERQLRRLAALGATESEPLAKFLAGRSRYDEALDLLISANEKAPSARTAQAVTQVLTLAASRTKGAFAEPARASQLLADATRAYASNSAFLFDLGTLYLMQQRDAEAVARYEEVLASSPSHIAALNNLAILLAADAARQDDAIRYMERAIELAPDSIELKDSHAMVLMACGRFDEAYELLRQAISSSETSSRYWFHQAVVLARMGRDDEARLAYQKSIELGLADELLTPSERDMAAEFSRTFHVISMP